MKIIKDWLARRAEKKRRDGVKADFIAQIIANILSERKLILAKKSELSAKDRTLLIDIYNNLVLKGKIKEEDDGK